MKKEGRAPNLIVGIGGAAAVCKETSGHKDEIISAAAAQTRTKEERLYQSFVDKLSLCGGGGKFLERRQFLLGIGKYRGRTGCSRFRFSSKMGLFAP